MDVKKKIAYILTDSRLGGTERFLLKILKRLVKTDQYEMNIFTLIGDGALNKLCSELKIKNEFLQFTKLNSLKNYFKLKKSVTKFQPDIIHSFLFHANYFSAHLKKGLITPKLIVSERCLDISKNLFKIKLTRYYSGIADIVTAVSEDVKELLIKREGIPREKITLLKNGIEPSDYIFPEKSTLKNEFKIPDNAFVIINIARFRKEKGQVNLISAFKDVLKNKKDSY
ncbi:MAG: glycosyltransferase, partial [bacterium]|nr:glycosyltransferase [bacterium]